MASKEPDEDKGSSVDDLEYSLSSDFEQRTEGASDEDFSSSSDFQHGCSK